MEDIKQNKLISIMNNVLIGYSAYTIFLTFSYFFDILRITTLEFTTLITFLWSGNLALYFFVKKGLNKKLKEPDMFLPLIIWSIFCIMTPLYYMTETLRSISIMNYFLIIVFGIFKLNFKQFISITIYSIVLLGLLILMTIKKDYPNINIYNELILWLMFSLVSISFAFICNSIGALRKKLYEQKKELIKAFSEIKKISVTDELTGIYNRRFAVDFIVNKKLKVDKGLDRFIICMIDIDNFKKINDIYGHDIGDIVLKNFSKEVHYLIRGEDCFSRFGGEEFLLVLSNVDLKIAKEVVYRIMNKIRDMRFNEVPELKVTVSAGLVEYKKDMSVEELLKKADILLYKAKENGRDQCQY